MELKLAQYNLETGKFEKFLELGKDFGYFEEFILIKPYSDYWIDIKFSDYCLGGKIINKDKKDPLNRFNGLFDGRTYWKGKFVLIDKIPILIGQNEDVEIWLDDIIDSSDEGRLSQRFVCKKTDLNYCRVQLFGFLPYYESCSEYIKVGNLHENPELYEKLNCW